MSGPGSCERKRVRSGSPDSKLSSQITPRLKTPHPYAQRLRLAANEEATNVATMLHNVEICAYKTSSWINTNNAGHGALSAHARSSSARVSAAVRSHAKLRKYRLFSGHKPTRPCSNSWFQSWPALLFKQREQVEHFT